MENILLTRNDEIRICDFGQAERRRDIKASSVRKGKAKYMSPEVYNCESYDGFKADVWSLGIVLWGMLTGGLLYRIASTTDKRYQLLTKGQEGIKLLLEMDGVHDVSPLLIHLLSNMLAIDPEKRYLTEDVLAHPWLGLTSQAEKPTSSSSSPVVLENKTIPPSTPSPAPSPARPARDIFLAALSPKAKPSPSIASRFSFSSVGLLRKAKSWNAEKSERSNRKSSAS